MRATPQAAQSRLRESRLGQRGGARHVVLLQAPCEYQFHGSAAPPSKKRPRKARRKPSTVQHQQTCPELPNKPASALSRGRPTPPGDRCCKPGFANRSQALLGGPPLLLSPDLPRFSPAAPVPEQPRGAATGEHRFPAWSAYSVRSCLASIRFAARY